MDLKLDGKRALVTGSHRGTGLVIARRLLEEGAEVLVHGLEPGQAGAAVEELGAGIAVTGDIRQGAGSDALIAALPWVPDVLVNNYGTAEGGSWDDMGDPEWLDLYEKNVLSAARLIRHCLATLRERPWGRIINLGTVGSTRPNARMPHYYAAKGALATMTVGLARELAGTGVRVNLVSPGIIRTPEVEAAYLKRGRAKGWGETFEEIEPVAARDIPIRRFVTREEVADVVAFLASPLADGIHGQNLRVDGGSLDVLT